MIYKTSEIIVNYLEKNNCLKEDKEIYNYGARLLISYIISLLIVFIIGILMNRIGEVILFEIIISSSRSILGGYHCKSYINCINMYVLLFVLGISIACFLDLYMYQIIIVEIVGLFITCVFAPVKNKNKNISKYKYKIFKKCSLLYITGYLALLNIFIVLDYKYVNFMIYIFVIIQILIIGGVIDYGKIKK